MGLNHRGTEITEALSGNNLKGEIIGAAIEVQRQLGPGLLESIYEDCLAFELNSRGIEFQRQLELPVIYKGSKLKTGFRIDLLVEHQVVIELKAVSHLEKVHEAQLMTYLKLAKKRFGLLINFNVPVLTKGIRRILNG